jgi:hypothetical protein
MWNNMSDGTIDGLHTMAPVTLDPFEGRIDQLATVQDITSSTIRNIELDKVQGIAMSNKMDNGMKGTTKGAVVGHRITNDEGLTIGFGAGRLNTDVDNESGLDSAKADTTLFGASIGRELEKGTATLSLKHARTDYKMERSIGDFSNSGATKGKDTSVSIMFTGDGDKVKPIIGYTRGKSSIDGYTETGDVQSARTIEDSSKWYGYGSIGGNVDLGLLDVTAMHHTDGINDITLGIGKEKDNVVWRLEASRSMHKKGDTNSVTGSLIIKF